jgi:hypothetical protein
MMQAKMDVLSEARNSLAMAKARITGDFQTERLVMDLIEDHGKLEIAQSAFITSLAGLIDRYAEYLSQYAGIKVNRSMEIIDALAHLLASEEHLILDVDSTDVE